MKPGVLAAVVLAVSMGAQGPARADAMLCDRAAQHAAAETGVPVRVLLAITRVETGHTRAGRFQPWPWTTNTQGHGAWHDTRAQALAHARRAIAQGRSIDLGCFQINWRWHGDQFDDPAQLFDPEQAARYAAALLARFHAELGSWEAAAGAYHSRTPGPNARYRRRFAQTLAALPSLPDSTQPDSNRPITASAALIGADRPRGASLVPLGQPAPLPFIALR